MFMKHFDSKTISGRNEMLATFLLLTIHSIQLNPVKGATMKPCRPEDGKFKCRTNNQCIPRYRVRERKLQCSDGSDEGIDPLRCSDDEVLCRVTKRCVPRYLANSYIGCEVKSKLTFPCRADEEFECAKSKQCIPRHFVNDRYLNCNASLIQDDSDETQILPHCLLTEFPCNSNETLRCIPRERVQDGFRDCRSGIDERTVLESCYSEREFRCIFNGRCIPRYRVLDGFPDCPNGTDESEALQCLPSKEFRCHDNGRCIPRSWRGNTLINCLDGSDEIPMPINETCTDDEFRCNNSKRCIPKSLLCDGMDHCSDCSDEIESCQDQEQRMFRCPTKPSQCVHWAYSCDVYSDCPDHGDDFTSLFGFKCKKNFGARLGKPEGYCSIPPWLLEDNYANCDDESDFCYINGTFQCALCLNNKTVIAKRQICDGVIDCPDFSDECLCSDKTLTSNRSQGFCNSLCYGNDQGNVCAQCNKGELRCPVDDICVSASKVCNQRIDCPLSETDEKFCSSDTKTSTVEKDLDFDCDPILHDMIEATKLLKLEGFANNSAPSKAKRCDGITECFNFEDECSERANCSKKPAICDDIPLKMFIIPPLLIGNSQTLQAETRQCGYLEFVFGTGICDGILDCPHNIRDETRCTDRRFECPAGTVEWITGPKQVVSIPIDKHCDGVYPPDCVDGSDEKNCSEATHFYCEKGEPFFVPRSKVLDGKRDCSDFSDECPPNLFENNALSSRDELIKSNALKGLIWFMALLAIFGNLAVVILATTKLKQIRNKPQHARSKLPIVNNVLLLNLAIADFLMGIVLLTVGAKAIQFSGSYCHEDKAWRAGSACASIGVMTVLSSEVSVFTLVCITSYRLYSVYRPIASRGIGIRVLTVWIVLIWTAGFTLALLPLATFLSESMVTRMLISNSPYFPSNTVTLSELRRFSHRIQNLKSSNTSLTGDDWYSLELYLTQNFPEHAPASRGYFGYYSQSGVCMPKLYRINADDNQSSNPISSSIITFNFIALLYIALSYVAIYRRSTRNSFGSNTKQKSQQAKTMYLKISLLIATDMCCWFPVCAMTFVSMSGVVLDPLAYAVSAVVLLPINSSLNPIIYTAPIGTISNFFRQQMSRIERSWNASHPTHESTDVSTNTPAATMTSV